MTLKAFSNPDDSVMLSLAQHLRALNSGQRAVDHQESVARATLLVKAQTENLFTQIKCINACHGQLKREQG